MRILLKIKSDWIKIILKDGKKTLDEISFLEERNLSEKLLPTIDKLLKKNKLQPQDIQDFSVVSDLGENYTTFRLAKTVAEAFKFAVKEKGCSSNKNCGPLELRRKIFGKK